jgi:cell division protein FtsQ
MARKSEPSILQEELYPFSAAHVREGDAREEIDDARLIDLDVDEESPFLRGQKRVCARRSSLPRKTASWLLWGAAAAVSVCIVGLAAAGLYHYGEHSWRFRVESSDNIEVLGTQNVTKAQIMEVMGADIGRNIFFIPLAQQKAQLEQIPWVESASVMRFVPNRLQVQIHERTPVAFARVGPRIFLIDAGGTLMELPLKRKYSFPVILGMNLGEPLSTRAPRMKVYMQMVRELDAGGARYSQDLSEVDLSDLDDVKVRVNDPAGDVLVHLGSSDFLGRYRTYITHAQGWRQQFQKLESVDLRYENQIIVNPDVPHTVKESTLSPAAAKAAAAAGVKPAALITRLPRGAVPKPAFELSEKKLKPEAPGKLGIKKAVRSRASNRGKTVVAKKFSPAPLRAKRPLESRLSPSAALRAGGATAPRAAKPKVSKTAVPMLQKPASESQKPSPAIGKDKNKDQVGQSPSQ